MHGFGNHFITLIIKPGYMPTLKFAGLFLTLKLYLKVHKWCSGCPRRYTIRELGKRVQQDRGGMRTTIQAEGFDN